MRHSLQKIGSLIGVAILLAACSQDGTTFSQAPTGDNKDTSTPVTPTNPTNPTWVFPTPNTVGAEDVLSRFNFVDPSHMVPLNLLTEAVLFYAFNQSLIPNKDYLTVVDFTVASAQSRFFLINMKTGKVQSYHVGHGMGSDPTHTGYATKFSNTPSSNQTSLGFYLTSTSFPWSGHGTAVYLDGLSPTNSKARDRGIYFHGAPYVYDQNVLQGRSDGCLALSLASDGIVAPLIDNGSVIYAGLSNGIHK